MRLRVLCGKANHKGHKGTQKALLQLAASSFFSSFFLEKYQSFTSRPLLEATRFSASACVIGAGTITGSPGCQFAGVATAFASLVWSASKTRVISGMLRPSERG